MKRRIKILYINYQLDARSEKHQVTLKYIRIKKNTKKLRLLAGEGRVS